MKSLFFNFGIFVSFLSIMLSGCSDNGQPENTVQINARGDLSDFVLSNLDSGESWVFDSYQAKAPVLEITEGTHLSVSAKSDYHRCWFEDLSSEMILNSSNVQIICHQKPLFNVLHQQDPAKTIIYSFDADLDNESDLSLIKETTSVGSWAIWSGYKVAKNLLFNTEEILYDGLITSFDEITDKQIDAVFFEPNIDKNTVFIVTASQGEDAELFTLNKSRTALNTVNLISDLSMSEFINRNKLWYRSTFEYHHDFDGETLNASHSFEAGANLALVDFPDSIDNLNRIKLKYRDDLFYWPTENGKQMVRRTVNDSGTKATITPVILPNIENVGQIYKVKRTTDKLILIFTYGDNFECKRYYAFNLSNKWKLIFDTCETNPELKMASKEAKHGYLVVESSGGALWLILDAETGDVQGKITSSQFNKRQFTGEAIYKDGILITSSEQKQEWCTSDSGCGFITRTYFYNFKLKTFELLLTSDPIKFQPHSIDDYQWHSPLWDLMFFTNNAYNTRFKNFKFFIAYTAETGNEIWQTDGTIAGTKAIETFSLGSGSGVYYQDKLLVPIILDE